MRNRSTRGHEPDANWLATNLRTPAALAEAAYGGHDPNDGGVVLPDALRWVLRPAPGSV